MHTLLTQGTNKILGIFETSSTAHKFSEKFKKTYGIDSYMMHSNDHEYERMRVARACLDEGYNAICIEEHGDPSVGIMPQYLFIELPFTTDDSDDYKDLLKEVKDLYSGLVETTCDASFVRTNPTKDKELYLLMDVNGVMKVHNV